MLVLKFCQTYTDGLRRSRPQPSDGCHLDEVFLKMNGQVHDLWRAADQDGDILDILVQSRSDKKADEVLSQSFEGVAIFPEYNHHRQGEELQRGESCSNAERRTPPAEYQNSRAENSHQPTRLRERVMR